MEAKSKPLKKKKNPVIDTEPTLNTLETGPSAIPGTSPLSEQTTLKNRVWRLIRGQA